ncbi:hypothetical protein BDV30DRAFT_71861 [Aspergillus minisclerotigenes]|uniref:Uncharacterized protein n=1 Tax=Aspergillus minisclerotigenes TaxID=656917 RepID=A0A5N6JLB5_9EURO|nr:hypothetical protein BDV30DRAFT_71861 [Aspergillus minisclerotigenes]
MHESYHFGFLTLSVALPPLGLPKALHLFWQTAPPSAALQALFNFPLLSEQLAKVRHCSDYNRSIQSLVLPYSLSILFLEQIVSCVAT